MPGLRNIIVGWFRRFGLMKTPVDIAVLSKERLWICDNCDYAKTQRILEVINGKAERVNSLQCIKCKCPCLEKTLVREESCPINKW